MVEVGRGGGGGGGGVVQKIEQKRNETIAWIMIKSEIIYHWLDL